MSFIQIIEYTTTDVDKVREVDEEWEKATEGKRTARRAITCQDRNNRDRYFQIVFFDSYESAMENSNLPETQAAAEKYAAVTGPPTFYDLDVLAEME